MAHRWKSDLYQATSACLFSNHAKTTLVPLSVRPNLTPRQPGDAWAASARIFPNSAWPGSGPWAKDGAEHIITATDAAITHSRALVIITSLSTHRRLILKIVVCGTVEYHYLTIRYHTGPIKCFLL